MSLENFVDEEEVGEERAQVNRRVQVVDQHGANRPLGEDELHRRLRVARVAIDDLLDLALEAAGPDGTVAIRLEGDAAWRRVRIETTVAPASARASCAKVARDATLDRVRRVAELLGGRLERDLVPPSLAALVLCASPAPNPSPART